MMNIFLKITYTFVYVSSDSNKSISQRAGTALLLRIRRGVVGEDSFNIETQQQTQEAARLTLLRKTHKG